MKLEEHTKSGKTHEVRLIDTINYGILLLFHVCFDEMIRKEHKHTHINNVTLVECMYLVFTRMPGELP